MKTPDSPARAATPLKIAAIDLDGTLLGPTQAISPANFAAVEKLQRSGYEVVLATGRHYQSLLPYARQLPMVRWIVSAQGGEVSNASRSAVLARAFLSEADAQAIRAAGDQLDVTALTYTPEGIFTDAIREADVQWYSNLAGYRVNRVSREELPTRSIFKVVWRGEPEQLTAAQNAPGVTALPVQKLRTHQRLMELMPVTVSKATGLAELAAHLHFTPDAVVAFGDAENDISMFDWAGSSVAMPHGWPAALKHARHVGPAGSPENAFARAVDFILAT